MAVAILVEEQLAPAPALAPLILLRPRPLVFATYLAPNIRPVYEFIASTVGEQLERPTRLVVGHSFNELRDGEVDFAFLCGLPYVRLTAASPLCVVPLAAPVLRGDRYADSPRYYSDVIVHAASPLRCFEHLQGKVWAYSEPDSHAGYLITLFHLLQKGLRADYFSRRVMTGYHQESMRAVAEGEVDASAIDSQVLAVELRNQPHLLSSLRIIDSFGPSPIQPLVAAAHVSSALREDVTEIVTNLSGAYAKSELDKGLIHRFVPIDDAHYDDIRAMLKAVEAQSLSF